MNLGGKILKNGDEDEFIKSRGDSVKWIKIFEYTFRKYNINKSEMYTVKSIRISEKTRKNILENV